MSTYFVRMTPLEPFTFGGEKGFAFESRDAGSGRNNTATTSYYQTSKEVPEQTTIIGMLRYIILQQAGAVKAFSDYSQDDRKKIWELVGKRSFSFQEQEFCMGKLWSVSPVFIVDQEKDPEKISYFVRNPLNNLGNDGYLPIKMQEETVHTSKGELRLPATDESGYTTKTSLKYGYLNLGSRQTPQSKYIGDMFLTDLLTGNRKNEKSSEEDGFFKRQAIRFKRKNYGFAAFVECEEGALPQKTIASMGLKKSAFVVECTPAKKNDLEDRIQKALTGLDNWYYAVSDVLAENVAFDSFSIISKKSVRNMKTNLDGKCFASAVKRADRQYNLIAAGSVFFERSPVLKKNENLRKAGYNCIVKIGGTE